MDLIYTPKLLVRHFQFFNHNIIIHNSGRYRVRDGSGLFVHFLQHKMLIARLLRRVRIPVDGGRLLGQLLLIQRKELKAVGPQNGHLLIFHIIYGSGIFQNSRNIRGNKASPVVLPHNQRTVFSGRINLTGMVCKHDSQSIGAFHPVKHLGDGFHGIPLVIIIQQMGQHLRIGLRHKMVTLVGKLLFQWNIILNNTVMHHRDTALLIGVRMGVVIAGRAVGGPSGVADAAASRHGLSSPGKVFQNFQSADGFLQPDPFPIIHCHSRRVIPPVLQL